MDVPLETRRRALLGALETRGKGWHTRGDLAQTLGKKRLNPADIATLETLVESGAVLRQTMSPRLGLQAYVYTLKHLK